MLRTKKPSKTKVSDSRFKLGDYKIIKLNLTEDGNSSLCLKARVSLPQI